MVKQVLFMHGAWFWMDAILDNILNICIEILKRLIDLHSNSILRISKGDNLKYGNRDIYYRIVYNSAKNWKERT